ncbi:MAG: alanine racemase [Actinomycetota bacterium]|nr:alanine racemase [Actinomycetota bacterium]
MRPAWAEIDLDALGRNVATIRARLSPGARYLSVVKANAYGHGSVEVARAALNAGADWLGVILVAEARMLREAGIDAPILLLHEPHPEAAAECVALALTPVVFTEQAVAALDEAAEKAGRTVHVHIKIDTGLNRLGVPLPRLDELVNALAKSGRLEVEGVMSHFAFADEPANTFIDTQLSRFEDGCERLRSHGIQPAIRHVANSAATLTRSEAHFDMVRVGIAQYGLAPGPTLENAMDYAPVMALKARAAMVKRVSKGDGVSYGLRYVLERDGTIVSIPLGYADGWPRSAAGVTSVLIGGRRHRTVGTVCMDSFMADIGDFDCDVGDEVVLFGAQGNERISAEEVAEATGTINYEVVTRVSPRIPRVYIRGNG